MSVVSVVNLDLTVSLSDQLEWLENFKQKKGRPLRVLHIGNIANNAYLNAKIMRRYGIEADVICNDYYDVMGYPEWEELDLELDWVNRIHPKFTKKMLNKFKRPRWFYQGPLWLVTYYMLLPPSSFMRKRVCGFIVFNSNSYKKLISCLKLLSKFIYFFSCVKSVLFKLIGVICKLFLREKLTQKLKKINKYVLSGVSSFLFRRDGMANKFVSELDLPLNDLYQYVSQKQIIRLSRVFENYDIIQGYAISGLYPLLANSKYMAYEHGTIRFIPFEDSVRGRVCRAVYNNAEVVFVTNSDCYKIAEENAFGKIKYPLPHAIDDQKLFKIYCQYKSEKKLQFDIPIFIAPARQYKTKRNDLLIMALALLRDLDFKVIFIEWGANLEENKELARKLKVEDKIIWKPVMGKKLLWQHYVACRGVIDSFGIPAMGTVAVEALAFSCPLISNLDLRTLNSFFGCEPPMLNASKPEEIAEKLRLLISNPRYADELGDQSKNWFMRYHSSEVIIASQLNAYRSQIEFN